MVNKPTIDTWIPILYLRQTHVSSSKDSSVVLRPNALKKQKFRTFWKSKNDPKLVKIKHKSLVNGHFLATFFGLVLTPVQVPLVWKQMILVTSSGDERSCPHWNMVSLERRLNMEVPEASHISCRNFLLVFPDDKDWFTYWTTELFSYVVIYYLRKSSPVIFFKPNLQRYCRCVCPFVHLVCKQADTMPYVFFHFELKFLIIVRHLIMKFDAQTRIWFLHLVCLDDKDWITYWITEMFLYVVLKNLINLSSVIYF